MIWALLCLCHIQPPIMYEGHFAFPRGKEKIIIIDECVPAKQARPYKEFCNKNMDSASYPLCFTTGAVTRSRCISNIRQNTQGMRVIKWKWHRSL